MLSKNKIKFINSLQKLKYRIDSQLFIAEGAKIINEIIRENHPFDTIFTIENWKKTNNGLLKNIPEKKIQEITTHDMKKISTLVTPTEVLALCNMLPNPPIKGNPETELVIALDRIQDPGNMGTIIRIADWFGIKRVICSHDCVDHYNTKVIQSTMGSFTRVLVDTVQLDDWLTETKEKGIPIYGAILDGESLFTSNLSKTGVLLMGNESQGICKSLLNLVTHPISIPNFSQGKSCDSLNVSIATAVICGEFKRQQEGNI